MFLRRERMKRPRARYVATRFGIKRDCMWSDVVSRGDDPRRLRWTILRRRPAQPQGLKRRPREVHRELQREGRSNWENGGRGSVPERIGGGEVTEVLNPG